MPIKIHQKVKGFWDCFRWIMKSSPEGQLWRRKYLTRDNHRCTKCRTDKCLTVHHIIGVSQLVKKYNITDPLDRRLWEIKNGLTLCKQCHKWKEEK